MEQIQIDYLTADFLGVGIAPNGRKISYPYTLPGDVVSVEYTKKKSRPGRYRLVDFIHKQEWSEVRCPHFSECGGCAGQHIKYIDQCDLKFAPIKTAFKNDFDMEFETVTAEETFHYRSRMDFSVFPGPRIGLRARGNFRRVIDVNKCYIQTSWANEELEKIRLLLNEYSTFPWDRRSEVGGLKYVTLRKAKFTSESMTIFTFTDGFASHPEYEEFKERALQILGADHILNCFNRVKSEVSASGTIEILKGESTYKEVILGVPFQVPFDSFFQPNPAGFLPILHFIEKGLPRERTSLTDLFCGNGFFATLFGKSFPVIHCYELTASSIEVAKNNLLTLFPEKEIEATVVNLFLDTSLLRSDPDGVLILDPPRAGAGTKVNDWIRHSGPKDLFYVSCNPYSQLEDLKQYLEMYEPISCLLLDPYPHTPHCESVVHLRRKN